MLCYYYEKGYNFWCLILFNMMQLFCNKIFANFFWENLYQTAFHNLFFEKNWLQPMFTPPCFSFMNKTNKPFFLRNLLHRRVISTFHFNYLFPSLFSNFNSQSGRSLCSISNNVGTLISTFQLVISTITKMLL